jgi:hypothetical protein
VSEYEHNEHLLDEIQRLRESNFHLREGCEEMKQRIKRLEEAIESVEYIINDDWKAAIRILRKAVCNSRKAKEAKP